MSEFWVGLAKLWYLKKKKISYKHRALMQVFLENLFFKSNNSLTIVLDSLYSTTNKPKKKKKNWQCYRHNKFIYIYILYNIFFEVVLWLMQHCFPMKQPFTSFYYTLTTIYYLNINCDLKKKFVIWLDLLKNNRTRCYKQWDSIPLLYTNYNLLP